MEFVRFDSGDVLRKEKGGQGPGATDYLPRVCLFKPEDGRDVRVRVVERLPKDVGGSFGGRQLFQEHPNATGQCLVSFRRQPRIAARVFWFRLPGSNLHVSRRARADCMTLIANRIAVARQECRGVSDHAPVCVLPAQPDVLNDVLGLGGAAQHPIRPLVQAGRQSRRVAACLRYHLTIGRGLSGCFHHRSIVSSTSRR